MSLSDLNVLLSALSKSELDKIKSQAIDSISQRVCLFCHNTIEIPVRLTSDIYCEKCGDANTAIFCLSCVRDWLQLNLPPSERRPYTKHIYCPRVFATSYMNQKKTYTVDEDLMRLMDEENPIECTCVCGSTFDKRTALYTHKTDGTCTASIFKCRFCEFRGNTSEYIKHTTKNPQDGGCANMSRAADMYRYNTR